MINETGCDAVMIGRGALGNPWIFDDIIRSISGNRKNKVTTNDKIDICLNHISLLQKYRNENT